MKIRTALITAALLTVGVAAQAADPKFITLDHSTEGVIDKASVQAIWKERPSPHPSGDMGTCTGGRKETCPTPT